MNIQDGHNAIVLFHPSNEISSELWIDTQSNTMRGLETIDNLMLGSPHGK